MSCTDKDVNALIRLPKCALTCSLIEWTPIRTTSTGLVDVRNMLAIVGMIPSRRLDIITTNTFSSSVATSVAVFCCSEVVVDDFLLLTTWTTESVSICSLVVSKWTPGLPCLPSLSPIIANSLIAVESANRASTNRPSCSKVSLYKARYSTSASCLMVSAMCSISFLVASITVVVSSL